MCSIDYLQKTSAEELSDLTPHDITLRVLEYAYKSDDYEFENVAIGVIIDKSPV